MLRQIPELVVEHESEYFARAKFRSVPVDLLLTKNRLFKQVEREFTATHRFAEWEVPTVTVEGLIVLKLYALPSLYRQFDWDRIYVYKSGIKLLLARHKPRVEPLLKMIEPHVAASDMVELTKMMMEEQQRIAKVEGGQV